MVKANDPPYLHLFLCIKFAQKTRYYPYIKRSLMIELIKRNFKIPSTLHNPIFNQMEKEGLIKKINQKRYRILKSKCGKKLEKFNKKFII